MTLFLVSLALAYIITVYFLTNPLRHSKVFMWRRFTNWFPLGMTYSFLYMGRYNLTVAAVALGSLLTKAEFGWIASVGATTYALALTFVGPIVDRIGGKRGMIVGALGSALMNAAMAGVLFLVLNGRTAIEFGPVSLPLKLPVWFAVLYGLNMLCQSFGAISTIKVKSYWFHVRERGTFGAIFGTLISLGVYFAFDWGRAIAGAVQLEQPTPPTATRQILNQFFLLDGRTVPALWLIFLIPAIIMVIWAFVDAIMLKDTPDQAGFPPLNTHDASHDEPHDHKHTYLGTIWKIISNPIILMIGVVELTSGVLRDGILNWYLLFARETPLGVKAVTDNWGMWGAVTGIMGGYAAGWVSDRFFQSRRAPAAGMMQVVMFATTGVMILSLWWLPFDAKAEGAGAFTAWFIGARPWILGICAVGTMMAVIGVHSIMSGTATADFGGKKAAATATGIADAFSKLGSALQAAVLGQLVTKSWIWWPAFLFPFTVIGLIFAIRMWTLLPAATKKYLAEVEGKEIGRRRGRDAV